MEWDKDICRTYGSHLIDCASGNRVEDKIKHEITKLMVRTVDTDFIFLLLVFMPHFMTINNNIELFCDFGTDKHRKVIMVNPLLRDLIEDVYI